MPLPQESTSEFRTTSEKFTDTFVLKMEAIQLLNEITNGQQVRHVIESDLSIDRIKFYVAPIKTCSMACAADLRLRHMQLLILRFLASLSAILILRSKQLSSCDQRNPTYLVVP